MPLLAAALLSLPLLVPGGAVASDDGVWSLLSFPPPAARVQHAAIYDPVRNRMLLFGGLAGSSLKNDVWELGLAGTPTWKLLSVGGTPPSPRRGASAIYDPVRDRMLIYGGAAPSPQGDLWALSLGTSPAWTQLTPTGTPPASRSGQSAIYDPVRDRMVVFGGQTGLTYRNDAWALSLAGTPAWSSVAPSGGPPDLRSRHSAIYDSVRDRMVVFGGTNGTDLWGDLWSLTFAGTPAWTLLTPAGTPPPPRVGHKAIYDATRDRMVLFGGDDGSGDPPGTAWALPFASPTWAALSPSGPTPNGRFDHVAVLDTAGDRMLVFGGLSDVPTNELLSLGLSGGTSWTTLSPAGGPPPPRTSHAAAYDTPRDRMVVFGGQGSGVLYQDAWALQISTQVWVNLNPSGTKPVARSGALMVYDSTHDRMLVFGGADVSNNAQNDVWSLSLGASPAWTKLSPLGTPPAARSGAAGVYDPVNDRLVLFGGTDNSVMSDVWALSLSGTPTWTLLTTSGTPPLGRFLAGSTRNPVTNQMVIFGGTDSTLFDDVWTLSLTGFPAWTQIGATGTPPSGRYQPTAIYDQSRDRLVVFGGFDGHYCGDTWALSLTGSPAWTQLLPTGTSPTPRYGQAAVYDSFSKQMLVYGGLDGLVRDDTYSLFFGDVTAVAVDPFESAPAAVTLHAAYPNPFRAQATIAFDVARPREGRVAVYDVHGRLVRELRRGLLPEGSSSVRWDGTDDRGVMVAAGAYFYRIESEGIAQTRKVVLLH